MMEWVRRRDPAVVAIVLTLVGALVVLVSVNLNRLPFLNSATTYQADFQNAGGLQSGDDVRVAGISVGSVSSVKVQGAHVEVDFTVRDDLKLGGRTAASVEIATVLGELFMQVESAGPGTLPDGATIPVSRTSVPFTLLDALGDLGKTSRATNLPNLRKSFTQLAATLQGVRPSDVTATLKGLTSISNAIASRQDEITQVLSDARTIIGTLNSKRNALVRLMANGDTFLRLLDSRKAVINRLLTDTSNLGRQLSTLVTRNGAQLKPLLDNLDTVTGVLAKDRSQLQQAITTLGQFSTNIANVSGSGPWIDVMLPVFLQPDSLIAACGTDPKPGCGR